MEQNSTLNFTWEGDNKRVGRMKEPQITLFVNGTECASGMDYFEPFALDIPISGNTLSLKAIAKDGEKKRKEQ